MTYSAFIVEDDPMVADINRRVIEKLENFKIVGSSANEQDALEKIMKLLPDIVLLDIYLPNGNGLNILKTVRQSELAVDFILVTASKDVQTVYSTMRFGAIDYIVKPFDLERLELALNNYAKMRSIFSKKEEVHQQDLDRIKSKINEPANFQEQLNNEKLPKGFHKVTLEQIITILIKKNKPITSNEIAAMLSLSKITVWRYLEYLVDIKKIKYSLVYGAAGRPSKIYFMEGCGE